VTEAKYSARFSCLEQFVNDDKCSIHKNIDMILTNDPWYRWRLCWARLSAIKTHCSI